MWKLLFIAIYWNFQITKSRFPYIFYLFPNRMSYHGGMKGDHWGVATKPHMGIGGDILNWLLGYETTRFKQFLKQHGEETITSIKVGRVPIAPAVRLGFDIITAGKFEEAHKKLGVDNFFHLYLILNDKYLLEKNETVNYKPWSQGAKQEVIQIAQGVNKTIDELIKTASNGDEKSFWLDYNPLTNNCQMWVTRVLRKNGLLSSSANKWINQDMEALLRELPHDTAEKSQSITDLASVVNRILQLTTGGRAGFAIGDMDLGDGGKMLIGPKRKRGLKGVGQL